MHSARRPRKQIESRSVKRNHVRTMGWIAAGVTTLTLMATFAIGCAYVYIEPSLPSAEGMRGVELQVPLRVYTRSGQLIAQIGEQRRNPVTYEQIPPVVRQAFLAAE